MAEMTYYDSPLTGPELDAAFRNLAKLVQSVADAAQSAETAAFWAGQAQHSANGALGWYDTPQALRAAYPQAEAGQWALVGSTASPWLWDAVSGAFVDAAGHLYGADLLLDGWQGDGPYTQTVALTPLDGGPPVRQSSVFGSGPMARRIGNAASDAAVLTALNQLNRATSTVPGNGTVTVTLDEKPAVDLPAVWKIREGYLWD